MVIPFRRTGVAGYSLCRTLVVSHRTQTKGKLPRTLNPCLLSSCHAHCTCCTTGAWVSRLSRTPQQSLPLELGCCFIRCAYALFHRWPVKILTEKVLWKRNHLYKTPQMMNLVTIPLFCIFQRSFAFLSPQPSFPLILLNNRYIYLLHSLAYKLHKARGFAVFFPCWGQTTIPITQRVLTHKSTKWNDKLWMRMIRIKTLSQWLFSAFEYGHSSSAIIPQGIA